MMQIEDMSKRVDVVTLRKLAEQMKRDIETLDYGLNKAAMASIVDIIQSAIGAPVQQPTFEGGVRMADNLFPGSPAQRAAFNWGVAWTIFQLHQSNVRYREPPD